MASYTKFYALFAGTILANLTADWRGSWNQTGDNGPFLMDGTKYGNQNALNVETETSATAPWDAAITKFITRKLQPQTISGTLNMVMAARELNATGDQYTKLYAYVYNATDDAVLGVLLDHVESAGGGGTEWPTTSTGIALQSAQTLSSVVVPSNGKDYYLVIEFGYRANNASAGTHNGQTRIGAVDATLTALADLTVGSINTSTEAGYFVFSNAISVVDEEGPSLFGAGRMLIPGADIGLQGSPEVATILNAATGAVIGYWKSLITAETGDNLPDGTFAITGQDSPASSTDRIFIYSGANVLIASPLVSTFSSGSWGAFSGLRSDRDDTFYILKISSASPTKLHAFSRLGVEVGEWNMPTSAGRGSSVMAPARDGSKVYFGFRTGDEAANGIGRFSTLGAGTELTALIPTSAGLSLGRDLLVTIDGHILCVVFTGGGNSEIRRYSDGGALLATYALPINSAVGDTIELSQNPLDETTFWVRTYPSATTTRFLKFRISDGTTLVDYTLTTEDANTTLIPQSCPFILYPDDETADTEAGIIGPLAWIHWPRRIP